MKAVGLSIEDSHMRVSIISSALGMVKALKSEETLLPEDEGGRAILIRESLLRWKKEHGIKGVVFGLDFRDFTHNFILLPLRASADIARALPFELEKHLPLPPDEYLFDFHTVETTKEGTKNLVISVRKERLTWIATCLKDTGLKLLGVRCSLMEAVNEFISQKKTADAILIYPSKRTYCIVGLKGLSPGYLKVTGEKELSAELEGMKNVFPKGIYIAGTGTIPAGNFNIKSLPFSIPNLVALSAFKKGPIDMSFLPEEFALRKIDYYPYAVSVLIALSIILLMAGGIYPYCKERKALMAIEIEIEEIKNTTGELSETKKEYKAIEEKKAFLQGRRSKASLPVMALKEMSATLPDEAWLIDFSSDGTGKVEIKGFAKRAADLIEPISSSHFKNVVFSSPVTKKDEMERFSLKMEFDR